VIPSQYRTVETRIHDYKLVSSFINSLLEPKRCEGRSLGACSERSRKGAITGAGESEAFALEANGVETPY